MPALTGINRSTLREQVLSSLRESILSGALPPGTKLGEVELAGQLEVSRGTVREALRHLQQAGLVEGAERNSLRVRKLTAADVRDLFDLRSALESHAAAAVVTRDDVNDVLADLERRLQRINEQDSYIDRFSADLEFHEAICTASGNQMLLNAWQSLKDLMWVTVMGVPDSTAEYLMMRRAHEPILEGLKSKDPDAARQGVVEHLSHAAESWVSHLGM